MKNKIGTMCMILGAVLLLAALSLFLWNRWEARQAEISAMEILPRVKENMGEDVPDPYNTAMAEVKIDGYDYIGWLSIPALSLELPVMSQWDYKRLKIAPCRYAGSTKTNNLVIAAHNYGRHFGNIASLQPGDRLYFTDMDGMAWEYEVVELDILSPDSVEEMTAGEYALTLFTCTYGGKKRITIRCDLCFDS